MEKIDSKSINNNENIDKKDTKENKDNSTKDTLKEMLLLLAKTQLSKDNDKDKDQNKNKENIDNDNKDKNKENISTIKSINDDDKTNKTTDPTNNDLKEYDFLLDKNNNNKIDLTKFFLFYKIISSNNIMKNDKLPVQIIEGIYIGSIGAANNKPALLENKITHIVNLAATVKCVFPEDFEYLKIDGLLDSADADITKHFDKTNNFISEAINNKGNVLVHCHAGISRSSTVIIAWLIKEKNMSLEEALKLCKSKRNKIQPNSGFIIQLKKYEEGLKN